VLDPRGAALFAAKRRKALPHEFVLGAKVAAWQVLPAGAPDFEEAALRACERVLARDPRMGKVPKSRRRPRPWLKPGGRSRRSRAARRDSAA